ncbi:MAG: prepilin-type N-terminal cleavage/methylation domain-containing protein [Gammaproteobacteria bacterium]|nr:prepilin-type N-terminal cleavage/methylation domain-containing protein [Gammaproteobacteria bacterium]
MNKQAGFTLVELVVVIVVLGLLAATALPKFINVTNNARTASVQGVAGGLRSAVSLARSQYVLNGSNTATNVVMDASNVTVLAEGSPATGHGGRPIAPPDNTTQTGIRAAMPDPDGYTITSNGTVTTYTPSGGNTTNCRVTYTPANDPPVDAQVGGC